jgi:SAM-dependent methyltransferase
MPPPREFTRPDGTMLKFVPGFRERVLAMPRLAVRPTIYWSDRDYRIAAAEKAGRIREMIEGVSAFGVEPTATRALELGCGPGIDSILLALLAPGVEVVGIDLELPLLENGEDGERLRCLAAAALDSLGIDSPLEEVLADLPVRLERMSATDMAFADGHFGFCWSDAVLEHVKPLGDCFDEMWRVLRTGAVAFHKADPFYWLKGCHRKGVVDMPWAHARLEPRQVVEVARYAHGRRKAARCESRLQELNRMTLRGWREAIEATRFDVLEWVAVPSEYAERTLAEFPDVEDTLLDGVTRDDLVHSAVRFWLRRP